jgi:hypothetical protein
MVSVYAFRVASFVGTSPISGMQFHFSRMGFRNDSTGTAWRLSHLSGQITTGGNRYWKLEISSRALFAGGAGRESQWEMAVGGSTAGAGPTST